MMYIIYKKRHVFEIFIFSSLPQPVSCHNNFAFIYLVCLTLPAVPSEMGEILCMPLQDRPKSLWKTHFFWFSESSKMNSENSNIFSLVSFHLELEIAVFPGGGADIWLIGLTMNDYFLRGKWQTWILIFPKKLKNSLGYIHFCPLNLQNIFFFC